MAETEPVASEQAAAEQPEGGEAEPQQPEPEQRLARKYATLSKRERDFKRERAQWEKEREAGRGELGRLSEMRGKAKQNIGAWLHAGNISPQDLNAFLTQNTNRANDPYEQRISEETRTLKEQIAQQAKAIEDMKSAQERTRNIDKINSIVQAQPDDFELIRHYDAQPDVAEYIDLYLAEHGERVTEAEACARIERVLEERDEEVVRRALAARKTAKRIGWQPPGGAEGDSESQPGDDDGAPAPEKPLAKQRSKPTRGKPKLTNASPSSGRREIAPQTSGDPYAIERKWEDHVARKTKRR